MSKNVNFKVVNTIVISYDKINEFDKTILTNVIITDFRLLTSNEALELNADLIKNVFKSSYHLQKAFNCYADANNNVEITIYKVTDLKNVVLYNYITFNANPSLAFVLITISNANYKSFVPQPNKNYNMFTSVKSVQTNLINGMLDTLLDINSPYNYANVYIESEHLHEQKTNKVIGICYNKMKVEVPTFEIINFTEHDKQLIYNTCDHIDDRNKYKQFIITQIINC